jgi:pre-mRNA-splicing factor ATP-dependent RNA helicase DHX15/PRP43
MRSTPKTDPEYFDNIKKCLLSGFYMCAAHKERGGHYLTLKDE